MWLYMTSSPGMYTTSTRMTTPTPPPPTKSSTTLPTPPPPPTTTTQHQQHQHQHQHHHHHQHQQHNTTTTNTKTTTTNNNTNNNTNTTTTTTVGFDLFVYVGASSYSSAQDVARSQVAEKATWTLCSTEIAYLLYIRFWRKGVNLKKTGVNVEIHYIRCNKSGHVRRDTRTIIRMASPMRCLLLARKAFRNLAGR